MRFVENEHNEMTSNYKLIIEHNNKVILSLPYYRVGNVNTGGRENRKGLWKRNGYVGSVYEDEFEFNTDTNFTVGRLSEESSSDYELYTYRNGTRPINISFDYATTSYNENMNKYLLLWKTNGYVGKVNADTVEFHTSISEKDLTNRNIRT